MKLWRVTGAVVGGVLLGEFEAETAEQAVRKAIDAFPGVSLCHQCSDEVSDLDLEESSVTAEEAA